MKFSSSVVVALAPLALGRRVRSFNARDLSARTNHEMVAAPPVEHVVAPPAEHVVAPTEHVVAPPAEHVVAPTEHVVAPPAVTEHPVAAPPPPKVEQPVAHKTEIILVWAHPGGTVAETTTIHEKVTVTQTIVAGDKATEVPLHDGATTTIAEHATAVVPAAGASHTVTVGGPAGLVFTPDQLNDVPVGDTIIFEFLSQNHTVTQSPFDTPCDALPEGMDSGFMANPNNTVVPPPQVAMQVMGDAPLWFYCAQGNHCGAGMVFSVNPTAEKTHAMFQQKAIEQKGTGEGTPITGGAGAPPAVEAPAAGTPSSASAPAPEATGNAPGTGQIVDGSCVCMVSCSAEGFPSPAQGLGARGGIGGALPMMGAMS